MSADVGYRKNFPPNEGYYGKFCGTKVIVKFFGGFEVSYCQKFGGTQVMVKIFGGSKAVKVQTLPLTKDPPSPQIFWVFRREFPQ